MRKKAFKYRFYPTTEQKELLAKTFGCVRFVYNSVLKYRTDAYFEEKKRVSYGDASRYLTWLKQQESTKFLRDVSSVPLQQCLRNQQTAFKNFFEGRTKYPTFKSKRDRQTAWFVGTGFRVKAGGIFLAKCSDPLDIRISRPLPCAPSSLTISMDSAGRYFASCLCEVQDDRLPEAMGVVGVDLGIKDLIVDSNGVASGNPRHTSKYAAKLAKAQRRLSKKKLGSKNREKARQKVARVHAKISDSRLDNLHKLSRQIVNENQVICVESLAVKNMVKNRCLAKAISDAGWGEFVRQLEYKSEWAGRQLVKIDRWYPSSKRCSDCGHVVGKLPLNVRQWKCPECGSEHDRDVNAAVNIKAAGLAVLALGEGVRGKELFSKSSPL